MKHPILPCLFLLVQILHAQLAPAPVFGDHMVLQRGQPVPVWGRAAPGAGVSVSFREHSLSTSADADGRWRVDLPSLSLGEPGELLITAGEETIAYRDVLVGDVWLCGGQSNMAWTLNRSGNGAAEAATADFPEIRLLQVRQRFSAAPLDEVEAVWSICSPESAATFSAVGYFFGRELHRELKIPIGLVSASRGGTTAEAWMPRDALLAYPDLLAKADAEAARIADAEAYAALQLEIESFDRRMDELQASLPAPDGYEFDPDAALEGAQDIDPGVNFLAETDGVAHVRRVFTLDPERANAPGARLHLGRVNDFDVTWINGVKIGAGTPAERMEPRGYLIPDGLLRAGENVVLIQLIDRNRTASFGGGIDSPFLAWPAADDLPLPGPWRWRLAHDAGKRPVSLVDSARNTGTLFYNGMIAPLAPIALRGVIWYQGESNTARAGEYSRLFPDLVLSWRATFQREDLPFLFVQLPNYRARADAPVESDWAELREAQRLSLSVPHTAMAVTIDLGEADDIHPSNKRDVGLRLARLALARTYGVESPLPHAGPLPLGVAVEGNRIRIRFANAEGGLKTIDGEAPTSFSLAGEDGVFRWAEARIDGEEVIVFHPETRTPKFVRYAWADNPAVNLVNRAGLPASPFEKEVTVHE